MGIFASKRLLRNFIILTKAEIVAKMSCMNVGTGRHRGARAPPTFLQIRV